jgi:steroid 5-alpha reductase family enzyme
LVSWWVRYRTGRNPDAIWGIALVVVGLIISVVATIGQGTVRTVLLAVGFLLLLGSMVLLDSARRR